MDAYNNPFAPGAGKPPPELAGRGELQEGVKIALERTRRGRGEKNPLMIGVRGVGKTVLLNRMMRDAERAKLHVIAIEMPREESLLPLLIPKLNGTLLRLSHLANAKDLAQRGLRALAGVARAIKVKYSESGLEVGYESEPGLADTGNLDLDLPELFKTVGEAAQAAETLVIIAIDEMQFVPVAELGAFCMALHRCSQLELPLILVGAGLPQLRAQVGEAKSYAERLFRFSEIGPLDAVAARRAIVAPIESEGASITEGAVSEIYRKTRGYAYFLQEWGRYAWEVAPESPITEADVALASVRAQEELDRSFFGVRYDRCTPQQRMYMRAMAAQGPGPYRSGEVARSLRLRPEQLSQVRSDLIKKGMIWSREHGELEFTVPLFDEFMRRVQPEEKS